MKTVRLDYPLALLCRVFEASRSGVYAALDRPPSQRAQDDERLKIAIKAAHVQTRETYGPLRMQRRNWSRKGLTLDVTGSCGCGESLPALQTEAKIQGDDELETRLSGGAKTCWNRLSRRHGQTRPGSVT